MKILLKKMGISVKHLECLDEVFRNQSPLYKRIENKMVKDLGEELIIISRELYVGGKKGGPEGFSRQMILGDVIEYIFTGRAYYYAAKSEENFKHFTKLILYCVNQLLLFDTITVDPKIRKKYIEKLEKNISASLLYEKEGDKKLAQELKKSKTVIWDEDWNKYDAFVDSILPKTLGCPKELIVFLEFIRLKKGLIVPLLLTQRLFGGKKEIAPPDFLVLRRNREVFGIEVGYKKEDQSREFSIRTSIPTFAVDLKNHLHNRCPICGENILYCNKVIEKYANGTLWNNLDKNGFNCKDCPELNKKGNICPFSNYYGRYKGLCFYGKQKEGKDKKNIHYHTKCVWDKLYEYRNKKRKILKYHKNDFFAQIPEVEGIESI